MLRLGLLVLAVVAATAHSKAHGTSSAYYSPRTVTGYSRGSYGRYPQYGHQQYYYHHRQPTYTYKTPTYATAAAAAPAAAAATATTVVTDDRSGSR